VTAVTERLEVGPYGRGMWLRLILGAIYVGMAGGQLASWRQMPAILSAYGAGGPVAMRTLAVVLVAGELVCGLWFLARPRSSAMVPVMVYSVVSLVWATLGAQAIIRGLAVANCGCFGVYLHQRLSLFVLAQDALLLVYAVLLVRGSLRARSHDVRPRDSKELVA
jgi:Methylamine utilisation protein MauE